MIRWFLPFLVACATEGKLVGIEPDPPDPDNPGVVDTDDTNIPEPTEAPDTCDPGDNVWVQRAIPLMWGRRAHGAAEIAVWEAVVAEHGRADAIRAMAQTRDYVLRWSSWLSDELLVARTGDKNFSKCYGERLLTEHDGALSQFIRGEAPQTARWPEPFTMGDVIHDALIADDVSVVYLAHLFARMGRPVQGANVPPDEMEYNRRVSFSDTFLRTYLGRDAGCVACHNSTFSVTDHPDPALDRTWQLPGNAELGVFGNNSVVDRDATYAMFRFRGLVPRQGQDDDLSFGPWGIHERKCVRMRAEPVFDEDFLGQDESFFVQSYGAQGSVWDLAESFNQGVASLTQDGLQIDTDNSIDGNEAFAHLVAVNLANAVWREAHGSSLTIAHDFPRTQAQRDTLESLAGGLAASGFSLQELLVEVATQPVFSVGLPETCGAKPYGLPRILDPWTDSEEDADARGNGPGDLVRRHRARVLLSSVHDALGWPPPKDFGVRGDQARLQASVGVFLREGEPGFEGSDLQGILAFESVYGLCRTTRETDDVVDRLLRRARESNAPVGEVVAALRDRLLNRAELDRDEGPLVEAILDAPLTTPVSEIDNLERGVRALCGAMIMSPDLQLMAEPVPSGDPPALSESGAEDCTHAQEALARLGRTVDCP